MRERDMRDKSSGSVVYLAMAGTLFLASGGLLGGYFLKSADPAATTQVKELADDSVERGVEVAVAEQATREVLSRQVVLQAGDVSHALTYEKLGVIIDPDGLQHAASLAAKDDVSGSLGRAGAMPVMIDRDAARKALAGIAADYEQAPQNARMDLEKRVIHESQEGRRIDVLGSFGRIEEAARSGAAELELATLPVPADITVKGLGIDNISTVMGHFETNYNTSDFSRNANLELAASKLNGYVLQPGVEFSFNDVVGARTEKEGYKIAGVISAGEMVDGLAGGTCQISSTLHGAAFFAGIGIEKAVPHSRPSTYVIMGMDATVVYPTVDVKLKNNYDFPVAIHFQIIRGKTIVEILGPERPYDKVAYEREIIEELPFETVTREDDTMPIGSMVHEQYGFFGYKVDKIRKFYKGKKMVKQERWRVRYAPVVEYVRTGINPDPNLEPPKPKKKKKKKRLKAPKDKKFRMVQ